MERTWALLQERRTGLEQAHREMSIATPTRAEILAIARNGKTAAASCKDGRVRVGTLPTGQVARAFELNRSRAVEILLSHGWAACLGLRHRRRAVRNHPPQKDLVGHLGLPAGQAVAVSYENSAYIPAPVMVFDVS